MPSNKLCNAVHTRRLKASQVDADTGVATQKKNGRSPNRQGQLVKRSLDTTLRTYHTVVGARIALHAGGPIVLIVLPLHQKQIVASLSPTNAFSGGRQETL